MLLLYILPSWRGPWVTVKGHFPNHVTCSWGHATKWVIINLFLFPISPFIKYLTMLCPRSLSFLINLGNPSCAQWAKQKGFMGTHARYAQPRQGEPGKHLSYIWRMRRHQGREGRLELGMAFQAEREYQPRQRCKTENTACQCTL